jgi:dienelactone hydrolase
VFRQGIHYSLILSLCLVCGHARAQQLQGIRVHMHGAEGYAADGTVYSPQGDGPFAAIVLVPDERGINQRLIAAASRLVAHGFLVVALDLNRGLAPDAATHSEEQSRHDLDAALSFLTAQPSVAHNAMGLVGWRSGCLPVFQFAVDPRVKAVELIDPMLPLDLPAGAKPNAAVMVSFAELETRANKQSARQFEAHAKALGVSVTTKTYPQAHSDFDDSENTASYRAADAKDLWQHESDFFAKHLLR